MSGVSLCKNNDLENHEQPCSDNSPDASDAAESPVEPLSMESCIPHPAEFLPRRFEKHPLTVWPASENLILPTIIVFLFACVSFLPDMWVSQESLMKGEYWRLASAIFAHSSFSHWGMNSLAFIFWGYILKGHYGNWAFPILPFVAGIISNALTVMFYAADVRLMGASGVVFAMYGLWLAFFLKNFTVMPLKTRILRACVFGLLTLAPGEASENVSHLAHFFGFLSGIILGVAWRNWVVVKKPFPKIS